jgi:hypothetical protein
MQYVLIVYLDLIQSNLEGLVCEPRSLETYLYCLRQILRVCLVT